MLKLFSTVATTFLIAAGTLWARYPTTLKIDDNYKNWAQATTSGRVESALFGMTRNAGTRFHEGIDIKTQTRMSTGEPRDIVYSVAAGTVAHISTKNNGSYGRYIVMRHEQNGLEIYTLYGHLSAISPLAKIGKKIPENTIIGLVGRTSTVYQISKETAHLHFEVGLALGGNGFDHFMKRKFGEGSNLHGHNNGFNLVGADPISFFKFKNFNAWFKNFKSDFCAIVPVANVPELQTRCPALFEKNPNGNAWRVHFTWFGLPIKFEKINVPASEKIIIESIVPANKKFAVARKTLTANGNAGETLLNYINIIFDSNFKQ